MRQSLTASGALLLASVCAGLGVHTTYLHLAVRGVPADTLFWPLFTLGCLAGATGIWMAWVGWLTDPPPLRWKVLAPRSAIATAAFVAAFMPWYLSGVTIPVDAEVVWFGVSAACVYCLVLTAVTPYLTNMILSLDQSESGASGLSNL